MIFIKDHSLRYSLLALAGFLALAHHIALAQNAPPVVVEKPETNAEPAVFRFSGTITSKREADLSPRVAGLVSVDKVRVSGLRNACR